MPLMSVRGYADHRGVTSQAVRRWIKDGRIPVTLDAKGMRAIDSDVADVALDALKNHAAAENGARGAAKRVTEPVTAHEAFLAAASARERRENAEAERAEIEVAQLKAKLVDADQVRNAAQLWSQAVREAVTSMADRLAAELAAESDQAAVHAKLAAEARRICVDLSEWRPPKALADVA